MYEDKVKKGHLILSTCTHSCLLRPRSVLLIGPYLPSSFRKPDRDADSFILSQSWQAFWNSVAIPGESHHPTNYQKDSCLYYDEPFIIETD